MILLAGPNGAGKSTLYEIFIAPRINALFINADVIQREELRDASMSAAYRAAELPRAAADRHCSSASASCPS